jgi:hypothetical protein
MLKHGILFLQNQLLEWFDVHIYPSTVAVAGTNPSSLLV